MRTRLNRCLVLCVFSAASLLVWPASGTAQEVLDLSCRARATLDTISQFTVTVRGTASYSCANPHLEIAVTGFLLLNGVPVDTDAVLEQDSSGASVDLSFPVCLPGVWTVVAIGTGADRALPAVHVSPPQVVPLCYPIEEQPPPP